MHLRLALHGVPACTGEAILAQEFPSRREHIYPGTEDRLTLAGKGAGYS